MDACNREQADILLIAGDLFHRQPLIRELKEANSLFASLENTQVVLVAGNHDYLKKDSYYRTFKWSMNVHMILSEEISCVEFPQLSLAVYGCSYHAREIAEAKFDNAPAPKKQRYEILIGHGGDEKHIPIQSSQLRSLGYDYVALGHIHKPQILKEEGAAYAGALEPVDKNDTGPHGYVQGEIDEKGCRIWFVPDAAREYIHMNVDVDKAMTGHLVRERIKDQIKDRGEQNLYKIILKGFRDPDVLFDLADMDPYGNVVAVSDETRPAYEFERLLEQNRDNLLGRYIETLRGYGKDSIEYQALCEGVQALMETRRG